MNDKELQIKVLILLRNKMVKRANSHVAQMDKESWFSAAADGIIAQLFSDVADVIEEILEEDFDYKFSYKRN